MKMLVTPEWLHEKIEADPDDAECEARPGSERCAGDGKPCYVGAGTEDAHWRCGTSGCGSDYLAGRKAPNTSEG